MARLDRNVRLLGIVAPFRSEPEGGPGTPERLQTEQVGEARAGASSGDGARLDGSQKHGLKSSLTLELLGVGDGRASMSERIVVELSTASHVPPGLSGW